MTVLCQWSRHEGGAHTGDDAVNNKLVPGQVLSTIIDSLDIRKESSEGNTAHTPGMDVIWIIVPTVTKEAPTIRHSTIGSKDSRANVPMYMFLLLPT